MRILLAEDEKKVATFIQRGLQEETFSVDVAHDCEKGEFLALTEEYDALILDLMLPNWAQEKAPAKMEMKAEKKEPAKGAKTHKMRKHAKAKKAAEAKKKEEKKPQ